MPDKSSVLILGVDTLASAVARTLLLSGHAVAMHQSAPERVLRRRMAFSDAWWEGMATLGGVDARRVTRDGELVSGLSSGMFVPLLTHPDMEALGRWPWDVVVDARCTMERGPRCNAELTVVLGAGGIAGVDCDLVIELAGADPGAVVRQGPARAGAIIRDGREVTAPVAGAFSSCKAIGDTVREGEMIGLVGTALVLAPCDGRLRGLLRAPWDVAAGEPLADVVEDPAAQVSGIDRGDQIIARAVDFAIELEQSGTTLGAWGPGGDLGLGARSSSRGGR